VVASGTAATSSARCAKGELTRLYFERISEIMRKFQSLVLHFAKGTNNAKENYKRAIENAILELYEKGILLTRRDIIDLVVIIEAETKLKFQPVVDDMNQDKYGAPPDEGLAPEAIPLFVHPPFISPVKGEATNSISPTQQAIHKELLVLLKEGFVDKDVLEGSLYPINFLRKVHCQDDHAMMGLVLGAMLSLPSLLWPQEYVMKAIEQPELGNKCYREIVDKFKPLLSTIYRNWQILKPVHVIIHVDDTTENLLSRRFEDVEKLIKDATSENLNLDTTLILGTQIAETLLPRVPSPSPVQWRCQSLPMPSSCIEYRDDLDGPPYALG